MRTKFEDDTPIRPVLDGMHSSDAGKLAKSSHYLRYLNDWLERTAKTL